MEKRRIDLYPPKISKNSIKYFKKCISASMVSTGGDLISDFEKKIKNYTKSKYSVAFNSGTSALDIAFKACRIQENTEVNIYLNKDISSNQIDRIKRALFTKDYV